MRKYLKSKDQGETGSNIFKEAKRRFHYEPSHKENKYFLHSKHKHQTTSTNRQFKDDFSSVKEIRNQTNEINESSWIVKLVNVMHENSEEDNKAPLTSDPSNNFLSLRPIQSKQIEEPPKVQRKEAFPNISQQPKQMTPIATKKNSVNIEIGNNKKRSRSQKSQSCDTVSRKSKKHSRVDTIKRNRNEVQLKRNQSQSLIKNQTKLENPNIQTKSMKNISCSKITDKMKIGNQSIISQQNLHSSKHFSGNLGIESKSSSQISKPPAESSKQPNPSKIKQKITEQPNFQSSICYEEIKDNILDNEIPDDLFALSTNQKPAKSEAHQTTEKRSYVGSIKKNRPSEGSQRKNILISKPEAQQEKPLRRQPIIIERKEEDIVTAREEQHLIDKYLNNDYSFKKQSNMFRYEYSTSDFDRSLLHLNKPAINLERPLNSGKSSVRHESYQSRREEKNPSNMEKYEEKMVSKREPAKKFNYFSDNGEKQTTQNSMSVEILTLRCQHEETKPAELTVFAKLPKNQNIQPNSLQKQAYQPRFNNEEDLRRIHQKYNYPTNKQNQSKIETRKNSTTLVPTQRENLAEIKSNFINRNPYLQESIYKADDLNFQDKHSLGQASDCPTFKFEQKPPVAARQRAESNFNIDNLNSISRRERTDSDLFSEAESDHMITRLNSKLNNYISQYRLEKEGEQPQSSREGEPTHRRMNLNFNELKKHHEFFQR